MLLITLLLIPLIGIFIMSTISYSGNREISNSHNGYSKPLLFVIGILLSNSIKVPALFIAGKLDLLYIYVIVGALVAILVSTVLHVLSCSKFIKSRDLLQTFVLSLGVGLIFFNFRECGLYLLIDLVELVGLCGIFTPLMLCEGNYYVQPSDHKAIAFKSDLGNSGNNKVGASSSGGSNKSSEISSPLKTAIIESSKRHPFALYNAQLAASGEINRLKLERTLPNAKLDLIDTSIHNLEQGILSFTKIVNDSELSNKNNK